MPASARLTGTLEMPVDWTALPDQAGARQAGCFALHRGEWKAELASYLAEGVFRIWMQQDAKVERTRMLCIIQR